MISNEFVHRGTYNVYLEFKPTSVHLHVDNENERLSSFILTPWASSGRFDWTFDAVNFKGDIRFDPVDNCSQNFQKLVQGFMEDFKTVHMLERGHNLSLKRTIYECNNFLDKSEIPKAVEMADKAGN